MVGGGVGGGIEIMEHNGWWWSWWRNRDYGTQWLVVEFVEDLSMRNRIVEGGGEIESQNVTLQSLPRSQIPEFMWYCDSV